MDLELDQVRTQPALDLALTSGSGVATRRPAEGKATNLRIDEHEGGARCCTCISGELITQKRKGGRGSASVSVTCQKYVTDLCRGGVKI